MAAGNTDRETLLKMRNQLIGEANQDSDLHAVRANDLPQMPQLQVDIDNNKAVSLGHLPQRCDRHALKRLGRDLRERLYRPGSREKGLYPGGQRLPRRAVRS